MQEFDDVYLTETSEKWKGVPPALATSETPLWMIERGSDKRLTWEWQGKKRILQEGSSAPFTSFSELLALVKFLDGNSDFGIHYGRHQAEVRPENLTELPNFGVQFSFENLPGEPAAKRVHDDIRRLNPGRLWIAQLPFYPIPPPYRTWLRSSAKLAASEVSFSRTDPLYARQVVERLVPDIKSRKAFLELFASLIEEANASPQNWGVTLHARELALNVGGGYYCAWLNPGGLKLMWKGSVNPEPPGTGSQYTKVPDSHSGIGPVATALTWLPAIRPQMSELIEFTNARSNILLGNARQAHSPGVLRYIEEELGVTLPDPVYPEAPTADLAENTPIDTTVSYWAGGFLWNRTDSKLEEFKANNYWRMGYAKDDASKGSQAAWSHYNQIKVGDEFAIKGYGGTNDLIIYYIGRVTSKEPEIGGLQLEKLEKRFLPRGKKPGGPGTGNWFGTLVQVTEPNLIQWVFHHDETDMPPADNLDDKITVPTSKPLPSVPLNTILYGPPGTGKTYRTSRSAIEIIEGDMSEDQKALRTRYAQRQKEGRIEFVTFHQSYSYEDFIEGLRPVMNDDSDDQNARYEIRPGILKSIATDALYALLQPSVEEMSLNADEATKFDELWSKLIDQIESKPEEEYKGTVSCRYKLWRAKEGGLNGTDVASERGELRRPVNCGKKIARTVWDAIGSHKVVTTQDVQTAIKVGDREIRANLDFVATVVNALRGMRDELLKVPQTKFQIPAPSEADREERVLDYLSSGTASGYQISQDSDAWPRYVLIIDEINRGNISKILGELITLLEDDKRLGADNELIVTLPYSRQKFALPPNLYIVGTMNTADKSIALVDLALRRRFEFEELRPDFSVCTNLSDNMRNVLVELNRRISLRKDRDHRIGHAYFIHAFDEESFNRVFERKIVPLLGEYFYGDWDGLRWVLSEKDKTDGFVRKIAGSDDRTVRNHWQWYVDAEDAGDFNPLATLVANLISPLAG